MLWLQCQLLLPSRITGKGKCAGRSVQKWLDPSAIGGGRATLHQVCEERAFLETDIVPADGCPGVAGRALYAMLSLTRK